MLQSKLPDNVKAFVEVLYGLSERDKVVLIERFAKDRPQKEVAKDLKMSDSRVKQIEDKLIKNIERIFDLSPLM